MPIDSYENDQNAIEMWEAYYPIPIVHYQDIQIDHLSDTAVSRLRTLTTILDKIEDQGVLVHKVPLSYDHTQKCWWMDYPGDYVRRFGLNPDMEEYEMTVIIKIDDDSRVLENRNIKIDYYLSDEWMKLVKTEIAEYSFISWDGDPENSIMVSLSESQRR